LQEILYPNSNRIPAHVDEPSVVETAYRISEGSINPNFFRYPSGHLNLLAIIFKINSVFDSNFSIKSGYQMSWVMSNIMMAAIPALVFLICCFIQSYPTGLVGGFISLSSPLILQHSQFAIVDVSCTFFTIIFFTIITYRYRQNRTTLNQLLLLSILLGMAISMKYTAALLILPFSIINFHFIGENIEFRGTENFQVRILNFIGIGGSIIGLLLILNHNSIIQSIAYYTTDGIVEIEYIHVLNQVSILCALGGFGFIAFDYFRKKYQLIWSGNIISPLFIKLIFFTIIIFSIFSPFTIIEFKKSFADFMYEYRHMKIGSAAQYHHQSPEYISLIKNLDPIYPIRFYYSLFVSELGLIGIFFLIFGLSYWLRSRKPIQVAMIAYVLIVLLTILSWQNVATRYTLNILPLIHVIIAVGVFQLSVWLNSKIRISKTILVAFFTLGAIFFPTIKLIKLINV